MKRIPPSAAGRHQPATHGSSDDPDFQAEAEAAARDLEIERDERIALSGGGELAAENERLNKQIGLLDRRIDALINENSSLKYRAKMWKERASGAGWKDRPRARRCLTCSPPRSQELVLRDYQSGRARQRPRKHPPGPPPADPVRARLAPGKPSSALALMQAAKEAGSSSAFITDRSALIDQTSAAMDLYGIDHGVMQADHWRCRPAQPGAARVCADARPAAGQGRLCRSPSARPAASS